MHTSNATIWEKVFGESKKKKWKRKEREERERVERLRQSFKKTDIRSIDKERSLADPVIAATEGVPSSLICGCVSSITGEMVENHEDIVIRGAENLRITRQYIDGEWQIGPRQIKAMLHHVSLYKYDLRLNHPDQRPFNDNYIEITESNGTKLIFRAPTSIAEQMGDLRRNENRKGSAAKEDEYLAAVPSTIHFDAPDWSSQASGMTNVARGEIGGRTNLKNTSVQADRDFKEIRVTAADGTVRIYTGTRPTWDASKPLPDDDYARYNPWIADTKYRYLSAAYYLQKEILPSGNSIVYSYSTDGRSGSTSVRLKDIALKSSNNDMLAWASFNSPSDGSFGIDVTTSDGRTIRYRHQLGTRLFLTQVDSPEHPMETISYDETEQFKSRSLPDGRFVETEFYPDSEPPHVKFLRGPVGGEVVPLCQISYYPGTRNHEGGQTDIYDPELGKKNFSYNPQLRLTQINHYGVVEGSEALAYSEKFVWGEKEPLTANLLCHVLLDEKKDPILARRYHYDEKGNVVQEDLLGALSGSGKRQLVLDPDGLPENNGVETYSRHFAYSKDGRSLRVREEEPGGVVTKTTYLKDRDKPSSRFKSDEAGIFDRTFYEYNLGFLVKEIHDDGSNPDDPDDLTQVNVRTIKEFILRTPDTYKSFLYLPEAVVESYIDSSGNKVQSKRTELSYTKYGQLESQEVFDADGVSRYKLVYEYDEKGRLKSETNALGQVALYSYDANGNKISSTPFGAPYVETMEYDLSNRLLSITQTAPHGQRKTSYAYNKNGDRISETNAFGQETKFVYDSFGHLIETLSPSVLDEAGNRVEPKTAFARDALGRELVHVDPRAAKTEKVLNVRNNPTQIFYPDGAKETYRYNLDGTIAQFTDREGAVSNYAYDSKQRLMSHTVSSKEGEILSSAVYSYVGSLLKSKTDGEGLTTFYEYDGLGRKTAVIRGEERTEYGYDALGRLNLTKIINGPRSLLIVREFDLLDRLILEKKQDLSGASLSFVEYTYDTKGNCSEIATYVGANKVKELFRYDAWGRLEAKTDSLGNTTSYSYEETKNDLGQKVLAVTCLDPAGLKTIETYDALQRVVSREKQMDDTRIEQTLFFYDATNRLSKQVSTPFLHGKPLAPLSLSMSRDSSGRVKSLTEAAGSELERVTEYLYNERGDLATVIKPDGTRIERSYDGLRRLRSVQSSDGSISYSYVYSLGGYLTEVKDLIAGTKLSRTYDSMGRLAEEILPTGLLTRYGYDAASRCTSLELPDRSSIAYQWGPLYLENLSRKTESGQTLYSYSYLDFDQSGRSWRQILPASLGSQRTLYDQKGRKIEKTNDFTTYRNDTFDLQGNVSQTSRSTPRGVHVTRYTYDPLSQIIKEEGNFQTVCEYDSLYNRHQKNERIEPINLLGELLSTSSAYVFYDPNGRVLTQGDGLYNYKYDALDRLVSVETPGKALVAFSYDGLNRRMSKTTYFWNSGWRMQDWNLYLYNLDEEIGSAKDPDTLTELKVGDEAIELSQRLFVPITDLFGTTHALIRSGSYTPIYSPKASVFGEETFFTDSQPTLSPWRYFGFRTDDETGLIYIEGRYYDPHLSRFLTPDPLALQEGINPYVYKRNNPLRSQ
jgi:RHS repeat-associated protein